jgi:predicted nucleotidyltransferase
MLTAVDVARRLADALQKEGIEYAIGGAIALGYYANPRATVDVDINIFVPPREGLSEVLEVLTQTGFVADNPATVERTVTDDGQFRGRIENVRVDVFMPAIEYYASLSDRKREVNLLGRPMYVVGPEDLVTLKMMFFRRKDLADVEAVLRGDEPLDLERVRETLLEFVGESDERVHEWDVLVGETRTLD